MKAWIGGLLLALLAMPATGQDIDLQEELRARLGLASEVGEVNLEAAPSDCAIGPAVDPQALILKYGGGQLLEPRTVLPDGGILDYELRVAYSKFWIAGCEVELRTYNGSLVGDTIRARPGDLLRIRLVNDLPAASHPHPQVPPPSGHMHDFSFNITNLHTHGLHVSPSGNSDNVLVEVRPGESFDYEIQVPLDHPTGTFWYHAHVHGSTAVQLSSGMSGFIIIEGGLDDVPEIAAATDLELVLQQISYQADGKIESFDSFGESNWNVSNRLITINGQVVPTINMRPGEVQRWRFVHSGVRENINLHLEGHVLHEVAADGLALGRMADWGNGLLLAPGYRTDVLVQANVLPAGSTSRRYLLLDGGVPPRQSIEASQTAVALVQQSGHDD